MKAWQRVILWGFAFLAFALAPVGAAWAQVKVTAATPSSAYQGTTSLDVVVTGSGFDPSAKVQYFVSGTTNPGGISVRSVTYRKSSELVTTIDVADGAVLASFDIQVTLDSGRKGKGTTLFSVKAKPNNNPPPPPPTYPAARAWHAFTSNGGTTVATSRLYMFGGSGSDLNVVPADLWFYSANANSWTYVAPSTTAKPGQRDMPGLACGAGDCVLVGGRYYGALGDSWVYRESTNAWSQVACSQRTPCPAARSMVALAFDQSRGNYVLFGGLGATLGSGYNDTYTFDAAALKWTLKNPATKPSERNRAAALYVPGVGVVVHGGQSASPSRALCDMYVWDGANWNAVSFDKTQPYPCLHSHSPAWDGRALVLVAGFVDTSDTVSPTNWRFTFAPGGRSGVWSKIGTGTCQPVLGTDATLYPDTHMAYDAPTMTYVYFGGQQNVANIGAVRYDNTVECY